MKNNDLTEKKLPISLDAIIFLILGLVAGRLINDTALSSLINNGMPKLFAVTGESFILDLLTIGGFIWLVVDNKMKGGAGSRRRFWLMLAVITMTILFLSFWRAVVREAGEKEWLVTHDGVIQTEVATRMLMDGTNPYAANFRGTALDNSYYGNVPDSNNLFTHFVYPPALLYLAVPVIWIADAMRAPVEPHFLFIAVFFAAAGWLIAAIKNWPGRCLAMLLTLGNPLIYSYIIGGYNDIVMAASLIVGALLLGRKKWTAAGIFFGLALAAKQIAWFFVPLYLIMLWSWWRNGDAATRAGIKKNIAWAAITAAALYLPFVIWNAPALFDDLVRFPSGTIPGAYPVGGSTIWQFWVLADPLHYSFRSFPSQLLQAAVGGLLLAWFGHRLWKNPSVSQWLLLSTALLLGVGIVGRFMHSNYLSILALIAVGGFIIARYVETD